ncbi:MAG: peptidoglycan DD-metalloendopeptidase family protein [Bacteriovoracaceae bacterium]|nr:peptidoglycan DD-metalloendopeptidase family protein [Bacteriovoracaceae bacterium]
MALAKLILISFLSLSFAFAANKPSVAQSRSEIMQLGARLNALERNLGQHNDKYLAAIERIRLLETDVTTYQQRLSQLKTEATKREQELASILRAQALAMVEDEVVVNSEYQKLTEENRQKAQSVSKEISALEKIVEEFQTRLTQLKQDEQDLLKLSSDLEQKKQQMTEVYLAKLEERQKLESQAEKSRISTRLNTFKKSESLGLNIPSHLKFSSPLANYADAVVSEKGVTYKFGQLQPLLAPRDGRVVYNGELASYGKVLMIDHGEDIRTVFLGRFSSELQKNQSVKAGDTLGHTDTDADSLYFEVRKKNVAQKTIHWLDQSRTSKI